MEASPGTNLAAVTLSNVYVPQNVNMNTRTCWKRADAPRGKYESLSFNGGWTDFSIYLKRDDFVKYLILIAPHVHEAKSRNKFGRRLLS